MKKSRRAIRIYKGFIRVIKNAKDHVTFAFFSGLAGFDNIRWPDTVEYKKS